MSFKRVLRFFAAVIGLGALVFAYLRLFDRGPVPNVVLITVDTLRADHLGAYGYSRATSPHIDALAKESILFRHAYSHAPETNPSLSALMTSHYPHETKVPTNYFALPAEVITLAEILKNNGYRTAAIVGNVSLLRDAGLDQGFDEYDDRMDEITTVGLERKAPQLTETAIGWLERHRNDRFFLWLHYMDPHGPYIPPPPFNTMFVNDAPSPVHVLKVNQQFDGKGGIPGYQVLGLHRDAAYYIAQYDGEIRYWDESFGALLKAMQDMGLFQNTLLVLTADHGEGMGEHDYYFQHSEFLYQEQLHVPLLIRLPGERSDGREIHHSVDHIGVLPELLVLLSIRSSEKFEGSGLLERPAGKPIFAETFIGGKRSALYLQGTKVIMSEEKYEAYDIHSDPRELTNLVNSDMRIDQLKKITEAKSRLDGIRHTDALGLGAPTKRAEALKVEEKMKALGYVQ